MDKLEVPAPQTPTPGRYTVAVCLVILATTWYMLGQLAGLFRPLLLAIFLCYIILPAHTHLTRRIPGYASIVVLTGVAVGALYLLALMLYASALELSDDLPRLTDRALRLLRHIQDFTTEHLHWLGRLHL